jgi:hypothetical protein
MVSDDTVCLSNLNTCGSDATVCRSEGTHKRNNTPPPQRPGLRRDGAFVLTYIGPSAKCVIIVVIAIVIYIRQTAPASTSICPNNDLASVKQMNKQQGGIRYQKDWRCK